MKFFAPPTQLMEHFHFPNFLHEPSIFSGTQNSHFCSLGPGWHYLVCVMPENRKSPISSLNGYINGLACPIGSMWSLLSRTLGMVTRSVALRAQTSTICMGNVHISSVMHGQWNTKMRSINQCSLSGCTNWSARPIGSMWAPVGRTLGTGTQSVASEGPNRLYG